MKLILKLCQRGQIASWLCAALLLTASLRPACASEVIFSNFGPGQSFNTSNQLAVWGSAFASSVNSAFSEVSTAVEFFSDDNYSLTQIDLPLFYFKGTNDVRVSIWSSVAGLPGLEIMSWSVPALEQYYNGGQVITGGALATISNINGLALSAGTMYFLMASPGASDTDVGWAIYPDKLTFVNWTQQRYAADGSYLGWGGPSNNQTNFELGYPTISPAFDVIGTRVSSVPVPAAAWLFGTGLLGLAGLIRRRKDA